MMDDAFPRRGLLPVLVSWDYRCFNPSVLALLLVPPGTQVTGDLGVLLFVDLIRALTTSFDSKLADVGNPVVRQIGRYIR